MTGGVSIDDFDDRLRCCMLHIALDHQAYCAHTGQHDDLGKITELTLGAPQRMDPREGGASASIAMPEGRCRRRRRVGDASIRYPVPRHPEMVWLIRRRAKRSPRGGVRRSN